MELMVELVVYFVPLVELIPINKYHSLSSSYWEKVLEYVEETTQLVP